MCEHCTDPDGAACYPQYGLGPHVHRVAGGWLLTEPPEGLTQWPENFVPDMDEWPEGGGIVAGTWYCPNCRAGLDWDRRRLAARLFGVPWNQATAINSIRGAP